MNQHAALILQILQDAKGDDVARYSRAFARYNAEEMQRQHGESSKTRQEWLDMAVAYEKKIDDAIRWVEHAAKIVRLES